MSRCQRAHSCSERLLERRSPRPVRMPPRAIEVVEALTTRMEERNETCNATVDGRSAVIDARLDRLDPRMGGLEDDWEPMTGGELMEARGSYETGMLGLIEERPAGKD